MVLSLSAKVASFQTAFIFNLQSKSAASCYQFMQLRYNAGRNVRSVRLLIELPTVLGKNERNGILPKRLTILSKLKHCQISGSFSDGEKYRYGTVLRIDIDRFPLKAQTVIRLHNSDGGGPGHRYWIGLDEQI